MKPFTILVVDDDRQILDFPRPKLKGAGYNVLTASNGVEAMEQAKAIAADVFKTQARRHLLKFHNYFNFFP